jgi:hypothetical protein
LIPCARLGSNRRDRLTMLTAWKPAR